MPENATETVADQSQQEPVFIAPTIPTPGDVAANAKTVADEQPTTLPEDHPLVKTLAAQKEQIRTLKAANQETSEKARQYDELQEANKTELQKLIDRAEKAEKVAAELQAEKDRSRTAAKVSAETGVPAELLAGDTEDAMRDFAEKFQAYQKTQSPTPPSAPPASIVGNADSTPANQVKQLTQADLKTMTPAQIVEADRSGQLNELKGVLT